MTARVPLDVDLEDRLLYGLTPTRLAYLVVALVSGFALWSSPWAPTPIRAGAALLTIGIGAVASWGRWMGRSADLWLVDFIPQRKTAKQPPSAQPAETIVTAA